MLKCSVCDDLTVSDSTCLPQVLNGLQTPTVSQLLTAGTEIGEFSQTASYNSNMMMQAVSLYCL